MAAATVHGRQSDGWPRSLQQSNSAARGVVCGAERRSTTLERVVDVLGVPLALSDAGSGEPVLFVHGMGLDSRMWRPQLEPVLVSGRRAITYDLRGHGGSGVPPSGYRVVDFAAEAIGLLNALGIERAHLVGLSLGGSVVARLAVRWPARARSVTILGSMASGYPRLSEFIRGGGTSALVLERDLDLDSFRRARLASFLYAPTLQDPDCGPLARQILLEALRTTAVLTETTAERTAGWPSPTDWDLWVAPDRVVPALVMAGSLDDPTFQGFTRDSAGLPRTRTAIVEGAAHLANMSHAPLVNRRLLEHLDAAGLGSGR
jgi:3-oxoadipate enol-lactonase